MMLLGDRLKAVFCQIDSIGTVVSMPASDFTLGEMRMVAEALRKAEQAIETEIAWRIVHGEEAA